MTSRQHRVSVDGPGAAASGPIGIERPRVADVVLAVLVAVVPVAFIAVNPGDAGHRLGAADLVSAGIAAALVLLRRRHPAPLLMVGVACAVVVMGVTHHRTALSFAVWIVLFTLAVRSDRTTTLAAGSIVAAVLYGASLLFLDEASLGGSAVAPIAWSGLAAAAGDAVRSRRAYEVAVEERVRRAEQTREAEARQRVAEERLRIARDLHDVVAHRMTVISVQSAAAGQLLRRDPDGAEEAFAAVQRSARAVLDELTGMLHVLRTGDHDETGGDVAVTPTPMLADLPALVGSFAGAGLEVAWDTTGAGRPVPAAVQVAAYRVVQEGLTNAQRHGDGRAQLDVLSTPDALVVRIVNRSRDSRPDPGSGLGLVGMRERVASVGGTLAAAARPDGCFEVVARLPLPPDGRTETP